MSVEAATVPQATPLAGAEIVSIRARGIERPGRFLISARDQNFISDAKASAGGPGEAVQAGELLLSALASCGLALVQKAAAERELALAAPAVEVFFERDPQDATRYAAIVLEFALDGVDRVTAWSLVEAFTGTCPIYNTLRRGGPIEALVVRPA